MSNVIATNLIDRVSGESTPMLNAVKGSAKAWVNFDGTTNPPTIRDSLNVLGITDNGTGDYTINFETNMVNENYSFTYGADTNAGVQVLREKLPRSISSVRMQLVNNGVLADLSMVSANVVGGAD